MAASVRINSAQQLGNRFMVSAPFLGTNREITITAVWPSKTVLLDAGAQVAGSIGSAVAATNLSGGIHKSRLTES
jgi:hypothetical protein